MRHSILPPNFRTKDNQAIKVPIGLADSALDRRRPVSLPKVSVLGQRTGGNLCFTATGTTQYHRRQNDEGNLPNAPRLLLWMH